MNSGSERSPRPAAKTPDERRDTEAALLRLRNELRGVLTALDDFVRATERSRSRET